MTTPVEPFRGKEEVPLNTYCQTGKLGVTNLTQTLSGKRKISFDNTEALSKKVQTLHSASIHLSNVCSSSSSSYSSSSSSHGLEIQKKLEHVLKAYMPTSFGLTCGMNAIVRSKSILEPLRTSQQQVYINSSAVFKNSNPRADEEESNVQQIMNILAPGLFVSAFRFRDLNTNRFGESNLMIRSMPAEDRSLVFCTKKSTHLFKKLLVPIVSRLSDIDQRIYSSLSHDQDLYFIPNYMLYNQKYDGCLITYSILQKEVFNYKNNEGNWKQVSFKELQRLWLTEAINRSTIIEIGKKSSEFFNNLTYRFILGTQKSLHRIDYLFDAVDIPWKLLSPEVFQKNNLAFSNSSSSSRSPSTSYQSFKNVNSKPFYNQMQTLHQIEKDLILSHKNQNNNEFEFILNHLISTIDHDSQLALLYTGICQFYDLHQSNIGIEMSIGYDEFIDFINNSHNYNVIDINGNESIKTISGLNFLKMYKEGTINGQTLILLDSNRCIKDSLDLMKALTIDSTIYQEYNEGQFSYFEKQNVKINELYTDFQNKVVKPQTSIRFINKVGELQEKNLENFTHLIETIALSPELYEYFTHCIYDYMDQKFSFDDFKSHYNLNSESFSILKCLFIPIKHTPIIQKIVNLKSKLIFFDLDLSLEEDNRLIYNRKVSIPYYSEILNLKARDIPLSPKAMTDFCENNQWDLLEKWIWKRDSFIWQFLPLDLPFIKETLNEYFENSTNSLSSLRETQHNSTVESLRNSFINELSKLDEHRIFWEKVEEQLALDKTKGWFAPYYKVTEEDTLESISKSYNLTINELKELNAIDKLTVTQKIKVHISMLNENKNAITQRKLFAKEFFPRITFNQGKAIQERHSRSTQYLQNYAKLTQLKLPSIINIYEEEINGSEANLIHLDNDEKYNKKKKELLELISILIKSTMCKTMPLNSLDRNAQLIILEGFLKDLDLFFNVLKRPVFFKLMNNGNQALVNNEINTPAAQYNKKIQATNNMIDACIDMYNNYINQIKPTYFNVMKSMYPLLGDLCKLNEMVNKAQKHYDFRNTPMSEALAASERFSQTLNDSDSNKADILNLVKLLEAEMQNYLNDYHLPAIVGE